MQGGYGKYPMSPTPDPKQVGRSLQQMRFGPQYPEGRGPLSMDAATRGFPQDTSPSLATMSAGVPGDFFDPTYTAEEVTPFEKRHELGEMRLAQTPVPSVAAAFDGSDIAPQDGPSGLIAAIGGALTRVDNGLMSPTQPERMMNAPQRYAQLRQLGLSDEEAQLMMQTGGA